MKLSDINGQRFTRALLGVVILVIIAVVCWSVNLFGRPWIQAEKTTPAENKYTTSDLKPESDLTQADAGVFKDRGDLAFVEGGLLYVLEGKSGCVTRLSDTGQALDPMWSHDGQLLAYIRTGETDRLSGTLWMVKRDGTQSHQVEGLSGSVMQGAYAWSPVANKLAVRNDGIWLVGEQGLPVRIVKTEAESALSVVWSPDGRQLAYSSTLPYKQEEVQDRSDALYTVDIFSGHTTQHLIAQTAGIHLMAWQPDGKGLLYWEIPGHGASVAADGVDLCSFQFGDQISLHLSAGLTGRNWWSMAPNGSLLRVAGTGREIWTNKWLELFDINSGKSSRVNIAPGSIPADPAFSPDARQIAYVTASDLGSKDYPDQEKLDSWMDTRTLWVANSDGSEARPLSNAGQDIQEPQWSRDGKYIMYISEDCLWMIDTQGKQRHKILGPFPDEDDYFGLGMGSYVLDWYKG